MEWTTTDDFHKDFGLFCVSFEEVCSKMEESIRFILEKEGLINQSVQGVLLSGYTAESYRSLLQNLLGECVAETEEDVKLFSKLLTRVQTLISTRNDLVHSRWWSWLVKNDDSTYLEVISTKLHSNKTGFTPKEVKHERLLLEESTLECHRCRYLIALLIRVILGYYKASEVFYIENGELRGRTNKLIIMGTDS